MANRYYEKRTRNHVKLEETTWGGISPVGTICSRGEQASVENFRVALTLGYAMGLMCNNQKDIDRALLLKGLR